MKTKTTLYDLLGVTAAAGELELRTAYERATDHYQNGRHGLTPEDADNKLKAIKEAWWILSDPGRRAAYDASLAPTRAPELPPLPATAPTVNPLPLPGGPLPVEVEIKALAKRSPLRIMIGVIGTLMIVGMVIQIFFSMFAFRQVSRGGDVASTAAERAAAAERRQIYGNLSDAEIAEQEAKERREREERRETEAARRAEYERKEQQRAHERELLERKRYADQVSSDLQRAEEDAKRKAEWDKQAAEIKERQAEAEENAKLRARLARERERLRLGAY